MPYLFYFLLHIPQLTLPFPPLHVEPLQQLGFLPWPVPLIVLQATAQVHGSRVCVHQEPPLLFPLPAECWSLAVLLSSTPWRHRAGTCGWLASSTDQASTLSSLQLKRTKRTGSAEGTEEEREGRWEGKEWESQWRKQLVVIKDKLQLGEEEDESQMRNC